MKRLRIFTSAINVIPLYMFILMSLNMTALSGSEVNALCFSEFPKGVDTDRGIAELINKPHETYHPEFLTYDTGYLTRYLQEHGYLDAKVSAEMAENGNLTFRATNCELFTIERVVIEGATAEETVHILQSIGFTSGTPYSIKSSFRLFDNLRKDDAYKNYSMERHIEPKVRSITLTFKKP